MDGFELLLLPLLLFCPELMLETYSFLKKKGFIFICLLPIELILGKLIDVDLWLRGEFNNCRCRVSILNSLIEILIKGTERPIKVLC